VVASISNELLLFSVIQNLRSMENLGERRKKRDNGGSRRRRQGAVRRRSDRGWSFYHVGACTGVFRVAWIGGTLLGDRLSKIIWACFLFLVKPVPGKVSFSDGGWQ
jgi:hypothetical protein